MTISYQNFSDVFTNNTTNSSHNYTCRQRGCKRNVTVIETCLNQITLPHCRTCRSLCENFVDELVYTQCATVLYFSPTT